MLCNSLRSLSPDSFRALTTGSERFEFSQSRQVVYRVFCRQCRSWHSIDFSGILAPSGLRFAEGESARQDLLQILEHQHPKENAA